MKSDTSSVKRATDASKFQKIMEWLSPCTFEEHQERIKFIPGTGGWLFTSDRYQVWESGQDRWLWCHGMRSAGKTFLAAQTVNELRATHRALSDVLVLVAFCSFTSSESQSVENILGALVKQVAQKHNKVLAALESKYHEQFERKKQLCIEELVNVLDQALVQHSPSCIVIDALDELYDNEKRHALLKALDCLQSEPRIMVTSCKLETIEDTMGKRSQKHLEIMAQPEDVEMYAQRRIQLSEEFGKIVNGRPGVI